MFYAYVIRSLKNGNLYKGSTEDIEGRLDQAQPWKGKFHKRQPALGDGAF